MRIEARGRDVDIIVHTDRNRSVSVFVVFVGLVAVWPLWYMGATWFAHEPRTWADWTPAVTLSGVLSFAGVLLAVASRKRISVAPDTVRVFEGPLRRPLTFTWADGPAPAIRLQGILSERKDHPKTTWLVKLVSGRHEYTLDERAGRQMESRALAEAVAKALSCSFVEKDERGNDLMLSAADLDLPYPERVRRYPSLIGSPVPQPSGVRIRHFERDGRREFSWGIVTPSLLFGMAILGLMFFAASAVPERPRHPSYLEVARARGDFHLYVWTAGILAAALLICAGFRFRLRLSAKGVRLSESIWGVPLTSRTLPIDAIEEVQVSHTVRGPVVQVLADRRMIEFRASDPDVAQWLAYEIRAYLAALDPAASPPPSSGATEG